MPLSEYESKEALRVAADCPVASGLPGSAAAREGIGDTIPPANDLDDLAAVIEEHRRACRYARGRAARPTKEAVKATFD